MTLFGRTFMTHRSAFAPSYVQKTAAEHKSACEDTLRRSSRESGVKPAALGAGAASAAASCSSDGDGDAEDDALDDALEAMLDAQVEADNENLFDDYEELVGQGQV